jgi:hypothetical protein
MKRTGNLQTTIILAGLMPCLVLPILPLQAEFIAVPNGSFESPTTAFVDTRLDAWQTMPKPDWYDESDIFLWSQLTGVFRNPPPGDHDHIVNVDGDQAVYLFAIPEAGFFQDFESTDWANSTPTHAFDTQFQPGRSYTLTVGMSGGGGNMISGVTLELGLYYRNTAGERIPVAVTSITNSSDLFPVTTQLIDFHVEVPAVQADDPWASRHIGIHVQSTVHPDLAGGYWNIDHVRLRESGAPPRLAASRIDGRLQLSLQSEPALQFQILATPDAALPLADWTDLGTVTNHSGTTTIDDLDLESSQRFYRVLQLP